jgi:hypothetical protein
MASRTRFLSGKSLLYQAARFRDTYPFPYRNSWPLHWPNEMSMSIYLQLLLSLVTLCHRAGGGHWSAFLPLQTRALPICMAVAVLVAGM